MKIKLLSAWIGPLPAWWDRYVAQMAGLRTADWECFPPRSVPISRQLRWFNELGTRMLGTPCRKGGPNTKSEVVCDFRPAYADLFPDRIAGYDWWGWIDLDMCLGRFDELVPPLLTGDWDVVTFKELYLSGCLTLFRNAPEVNQLYRTGPWREVFADPQYWVWDELGRQHPDAALHHLIAAAGLQLRKEPELYGYVTRRELIPHAVQDGKLVDLRNGQERLFCHFMNDRWPINEDGSSVYGG